METYKNSSEKSGITTGSVATAASLAALLRLKDEKINTVTITTPKTTIDVEIESTQKISPLKARATVKKPTYNDPDVTKGIKIISEVTLIENSNIITLQAGKGIGTVTKAGLQIPIGQPAINPVPKKMIKENISRYLSKNKGAIIKISIPEGEKIAPKTMNSRLGVVNGISILGTTGIARPMSSKAYKESLKVQIDVALANNYKNLLFVPGNIGKRIANKLLILNEDQTIEMSNFVGFMLDEANKTKKIDSILLFGHAGKLIKIAAGIFNTKQSIADARREIMTCYSALCGANQSTITQIYNSNTTEDMIQILDKEKLTIPVFELIADKIVELCNLKYNIKFNVVIVKMNGDILTPSHMTDIPFKLRE